MDAEKQLFEATRLREGDSKAIRLQVCLSYALMLFLDLTVAKKI
jgi:hypothetical protein